MIEQKAYIKLKEIILTMMVNTRIKYVFTIMITIIVFILSSVVFGQGYTQVILNLQSWQQYFGIPHVYQGDQMGYPTNQWPWYYGPLTISQYWSSANANQPVLELVSSQQHSAGAMFWREYYNGSSPVTVTLIGVYTQYSFPGPSDGFMIYLFLTPTMWNINPSYNYSIPYYSTARENFSPVAGDVIMPQSSSEYIIVQWDPWWQFGNRTNGATGQWNVWLVSNPDGSLVTIYPTPSPNLGWPYAGWDGIGNGAFQPRPGDYVRIIVIYDPVTDTLNGYAYDMSTGQSSSFALNLNGYYEPPRSGYYVFGVGSGTGNNYANWGLVFVATQGLATVFSSSIPYITLYLVIVVVIVTSVIVSVMVIRRRRH